jgi:serine/threonine-protein kinase
MASSDPFKLVGTIVDGRYRVDSVAGRGGYSVVYRAFHISFESTIALKVLRLPEDVAAEKRRHHLGAFQREGKVLFELSLAHHSIVKAFEAGVVALTDGSFAPYLALEWLGGVSLDVELKHRRNHGIQPMTLAEVLSILDDPAEALSLAHARGVIHRDIKPGNLFVTRRGADLVIKILDFGVAKLLDDSMNTTTRFADTGPMSSFTPMYAAPEQWLRRLGATGTWTDVHAWALVCVELLVGRMPFMGDEAAQFMAACLDPELRPTPRKLGLELPAAVDVVFERALALNPRGRFRDVGAFWKALCEAAEWSRDQATPVSMAALSDWAAHAPADQPSLQSQKTSPHGSHTTRTTASRSIQQPRRAGSPLRLIVALGIAGLAGSVVLLMSSWSLVTTHASGDAGVIESKADPLGEVQPGASAPSADVSPSSSLDEPLPSAPPLARPPTMSPRRADPAWSGAVMHRTVAPASSPEAGTDGGEPRQATGAPPTLGARDQRDGSARTDATPSLDQLLDSEELWHRR